MFNLGQIQKYYNTYLFVRTIYPQLTSTLFLFIIATDSEVVSPFYTVGILLCFSGRSALIHAESMLWIRIFQLLWLVFTTLFHFLIYLFNTLYIYGLEIHPRNLKSLPLSNFIWVRIMKLWKNKKIFNRKLKDCRWSKLLSVEERSKMCENLSTLKTCKKSIIGRGKSEAKGREGAKGER